MELFYFRADGLSVLFMIVITVVFVCSFIHSLEYFETEREHIKRFYACFFLTYGALMLLSCAGSLITFYLCYELMTLLSLPLVLHEQSHEALIAGLKYLFYSLCGAYMALLGLFFLSRYAQGFEFRPGGILDMSACEGHESLLLTVLFFMILGFSVKAGMFPMHAWLDTAHPIAPAPASAILSGVIVKSGVLGIIRTIYYVFGAEFFSGSPVQTILIILSLITVFMGSMLAYRERILKRRLAYSTVSQLSYILFGIFIMDERALEGSLLHIIAHAFIKSALFLTAGALIRCTGRVEVSGYKGLGKELSGLMWCYTFCALSLTGIPPTGGFTSKWYLAVGALSSGVRVFRYLGPVVLLVSALLTAGYLFPISVSAFFPGEAEDRAELLKKPGPLMLAPILVLTVLAVLIGIFPAPVESQLERIISMMGVAG
ncbi:MAG TPA: proton-conducting membrane transporter [Lachnospiraceae bacterium]|nr:proton-conducting membrane transporter [Lachnospiraceae bacterium]